MEAIEPELAGTLLEQLMHPVLLCDSDRMLLGANAQARDLFGRRTKPNAKCYEVLYNRSERCAKCPVADAKGPYAVTYFEHRWPVGAAGPPAGPCVLTTGMISDKAGSAIVYKILADPPRALLHMRELHNFALGLGQQEDRPLEHLIQDALSFLVHTLKFESARYWRVLDADGSKMLVCQQQIDSVPDLNQLENKTISLSGPNVRPSWWAVDKGEVTYVTSDPDVVQHLCGCQASELAEQPARPFGPNGLALFYYDPADTVHSIYRDGKPHSWLDLPLSVGDRIFGKISVSHPRPQQPFAQDECDIAQLFAYVVSQFLDRSAAVTRKQLEAMGWMSHELRQPAEMASHSVEYLKTRLGREKNLDVEKRFTLRNLEFSLRQIRNLNESQNLFLTPDSRSPAASLFVRDVLHPIVDMIRYRLYLRLLLRDEIELTSDDLEELQSHGNAYRWTLKHNYEVVFEDALRNVKLHLSASRLQQICFNLLDNALKYRKPGEPLRVKVQLSGTADASFPSGLQPSDYYLIQFVDYGLGIEPEEAEEIFMPGTTGSAARAAEASGTGVGLYLSRAIAKGFDGHLILAVQREPTRFDLLIPRKVSEPEWWEKGQNDGAGKGVSG